MAIHLGMHADNWREQSGGFDKAVDSAVLHGLEHIEAGLIHGQYFISAMGYEPSLSIFQNPIEIRKKVEKAGLRISMVDGSYPMMGPQGSFFGVQYCCQSIRFANDLGCKRVDSTDSGSELPIPREEVYNITVMNYTEILKWAEDYNITVCIEPHGPYSGDPEFMMRLLRHFESEHLRVNFDTGNTFIQGHDPVEYLRFLGKYVVSSHIKDVDAGLAAMVRGEETGIATSQVYIGQGVNADNIRACIEYWKETGWEGDVSIECSGSAENIKNSVEWLRAVIAE
jgi:sugar phosphate isomerase/epimerase